MHVCNLLYTNTHIDDKCMYVHTYINVRYTDLYSYAYMYIYARTID